MTWRRIVGLTYGEAAWLTAGVALLAYEVWALLTHDGDVLTRAMRANVTRWVAWPIGIGVLMGHLFGPAWSPPRPLTALVIVAVALAFLRDLFVGSRVDGAAIPVLFLAGFVLGAIGWSGRTPL